jgi:hypothetical protein
MPPNQRRPPSGSPNPELAAFIREKYCDRRYAPRDVPEPPNIDNYLSHPYGAGAAAAAPEPPKQGAQVANGGVASAVGAMPGSRSAPSLTAPAATPPPAGPAAPPVADLLGGFDDLLSGGPSSTAPAAAAPAPAAAATKPAAPAVAAAPAAVFDPFDTLAASNSTAPAANGTAAAQPAVGLPPRVSLDWSDFTGVPPVATPAGTALASGVPAKDPFVTTGMAGLSLQGSAGGNGGANNSANGGVLHPPQLASVASRHTPAKSADEVRLSRFWFWERGGGSWYTPACVR